MIQRRAGAALILFASLTAFPPRANGDDLSLLAQEFWNWRSAEQPVSLDDIPRLERPAGWQPDWRPATIAMRRQSLESFEKRWRKIDATTWPVAWQVDYRLIGSAIARVRWELEITRGWQRSPTFYVNQALGSIFNELLKPSPFDHARGEIIVRLMTQIPETLESARTNLTSPRAPFAKLAIDQLKDVRGKLQNTTRELKPWLPEENRAQIDAPTERAIIALESYRAWLEQRFRSMPAETAIGREPYLWFLKNVALIPSTPEELLRMGRQELDRAVALEIFEAKRNRGSAQLPIFPSQAAQMARAEHDEAAIRRFLEEKDILTVPGWIKHYRTPPMPSYLEPVAFLGVTDDLTSPSRLNEDGVSYIPRPSPKLGYFALATARDPRPIIVHEGIPGHYFQLVRSWAQENPIRRHYYDSAANEGIGFYAEEMMLQCGLFDDSPRSREIIYDFMRLRALRVEVDIKLATGEFNIAQAADYLARTVPMDMETATGEAAFFASSPGQAISYQIGKLQIVKFLADARRRQGEGFSLRNFHDSLWINGNVPVALQRWEYLKLNDEIKVLDASAK